MPYDRSGSASNQSIFAPPRLLSSPQQDRHATWLELFYDLVLVVAVNQVSLALTGDLSTTTILVFLGLFLLVWWSWSNLTVYTARFGTDDLVYRLLTFFRMFAIVCMAVEIPQAILGHTQGFSITYLIARIALLVLFVRALYYVVEARPLMRIYLIGFGSGTAIWAVSVFMAPPQQFALWGCGLAIEMVTPWVVWLRPPPSSELGPLHIPERYGRFTIIVLGLSTASIVSGLLREHVHLETVTIAALGFLIVVCIWGIYSRHLVRAIGHIKLRSGQSYIYSHFPLLVGIVVIGVSIGRVITESQQIHLSLGTFALLWGGFGAWLLAVLLLHAAHPSVEVRTITLYYAVIFAGVSVIIFLDSFLTPITTLCALLLFILAQTLIDMRAHIAYNVTKK
ncbi:MAG TPA: low temperature requirement protein A [Candidatus Acidoferrales bacterium]|nr:low temperature requirement protein A [Candidatus Acidoferrales bacterium]